MGVPKKRASRKRQAFRRRTYGLMPQGLSACASCGAAVLAHRLCEACGAYRGKKIVGTVAAAPKALAIGTSVKAKKVSSKK